MNKPKEINYKDTNVAGLGGKEHKGLVKSVASKAPEWKDAGSKEGIQIWRIEKFQVIPWPVKKYGKFHTGDSYIVLHTYKDPEKKGSFKYNVHFWLGTHTTQDEAGTAAYKTVELDTLLGDLPVQYRQVQLYETKEFTKLFKKGLTYLDGGVDTGFNHVKPKEYKPRLMQFKANGQKGAVRVSQVDMKLGSLNKGDVFLLDNGLELIQWNGDQSSAWERRKALTVVQSIKDDRLGRAKLRVLDGDEDDPVFWDLLGGKGQVAAATPDVKVAAKPPKLFEVSDATGSIQVTAVPVARSSLDTDEVYLLDANFRVYIWLGKNASKKEISSAMPLAMKYLKNSGCPGFTPITRVLEGKEPKSFLKVLE